MKLAFCTFLLLIVTSVYGQQQQPSIEAESSGPCSPNVVSNQGKVTITCGVDDPETAKKMLTLMNQILKNEKGNSISINEKLDRLMEYVQNHMPNPYDPVVMYSVDGNSKRIASEAGSHQSLTVGGPAGDAFKKMGELETHRDWKGLALLCESEKTAERGWATPFLFCSEAHIRLGDLTTAESELNTAKGIVHDSPDYAPMINALTEMLNHAKQHP